MPKRGESQIVHSLSSHSRCVLTEQNCGRTPLTQQVKKRSTPSDDLGLAVDDLREGIPLEGGTPNQEAVDVVLLAELVRVLLIDRAACKYTVPLMWLYTGACSW